MAAVSETLFHLPAELVHCVFDQLIRSRELKRVMRLRLVSRRFKAHIDSAIFRNALLSDFVDRPYAVADLPCPTPHREQGWLSFVYRYFAHQALAERRPTSALGRIRRSAEAFCKDAGDSGSTALMAYLFSLCRLAVRACPEILFESAAELSECSDEEFKADMHVAAVYLGRREYVERLVSEGISFCDWEVASSLDQPGKAKELRSEVFGTAFEAATMQGDVGIIQILLSSSPRYRMHGLLPYGLQYRILHDAARYGHRDAFNLALDIRLLNPISNQAERRIAFWDFKVLKVAILTTPVVQNYERGAAMLRPHDKALLSDGEVPTRLSSSASSGNLEMVRYFLDQGVCLNPAPPSADSYAGMPNWKDRLLISAVESSDGAMVKLFLDHGVGPNWLDSSYTALVAAARKCSVPIAKLLLDHGADVNEGCPPPIVLAVFREHVDMFHLLRKHGATLATAETGGWAMALAKAYQLESMVEELVGEGVLRHVDGEVYKTRPRQDVLRLRGYRNLFPWLTDREWRAGGGMKF